MRRVLSVLVSVLLLMGVSAVASADSEITVNGSGEVLVSADAAIVSLGVSAVEHEVLAAQAKANEAIASIRTALISGGISETDINTDYINIYAMYDYSSGREELTAYNANSTLAIRVNDIEKVGEVIDTAFGAGANTLNGISFSATDTSEARETLELRRSGNREPTAQTEEQETFSKVSKPWEALQIRLSRPQN